MPSSSANPSIARQLLVSASLVLAIFVILTAASVQYAVHQRAQTATFDRLQGLVYGILGATEVTESGQLQIESGALPDNRLSRPGLGLYAEVIGFDGTPVWRSSSMTLSVPDVTLQPIGEWVFEDIDTTDSTGKPLALQRLQFSAAWAFSDGQELPFTVQVVLDKADVARELKSFDRNLWLALAASAIALLIIQALVLRRGLRPVQQIGVQVGEVERGERGRLDTRMPRELAPLADSINTLMDSERNRHRQHRHLLDDLAHSLKTPLSVLSNLAEQAPEITSGLAEAARPYQAPGMQADQIKTVQSARAPGTEPEQSEATGPDRALLRQQVEQMQDTLARYLERAAASTPQTLAAPISPLPALQRLARSLEKLHAETGVRINLASIDHLRVRVAETDLMEMLGNVLENACKYGAQQVWVRSDAAQRTLTVEDDGPGFNDSILPELTGRGVRADRSVEGQGLGLAATAERLTSYGGQLVLGRRPEGGAQVVLQFPG